MNSPTCPSQFCNISFQKIVSSEQTVWVAIKGSLEGLSYEDKVRNQVLLKRLRADSGKLWVVCVGGQAGVKYTEYGAYPFLEAKEVARKLLDG